jgi:hypothetical protein
MNEPKISPLYEIALRCIERPIAYDNYGRMFGIPKSALKAMHMKHGLPAHKDARNRLRFVPFEVAAWLARYEQARESVIEEKHKARSAYQKAIKEICLE